MVFILSKLSPLALALVLAGLTAWSQGMAPTIQVVPGGNVTLTWNATATGTVHVERSQDLSNWSVVSPGNSIGSFTESTGAAARGFYRLIPAFAPDTPVAVQGNAKTPDLLVSNTETTWGEWKRVRTWAAVNGYDLANIGAGAGNENLQPVQSVSWYDAVKWCNAKSEMAGLTPVYTINGTVYRSGKFVPTLNSSASGFRLPTQAEWAWAAGGGVRSQGYKYSGSPNVDAVAWHDGNSGGSPKPVAAKAPNELELFDMSGNVFEWCWDERFQKPGANRGGSWKFGAELCEIDKASFEDPLLSVTDIGFRIVRRAAN